MDRSFLRSTPPMVALPVALIGALAYFIFAPTPPQKQFLGPTHRDEEATRWTEWRTPAFFDERAALDRSHPVEVLNEIFAAFREQAYQRVLAYASDRLHRRSTPEMLRARLTTNPAFTGWTEIRVESVDAHDDRVVIRGRSVHAEGVGTFRAVLRPEDEGWALDSLRMSPLDDNNESGVRYERERPENEPPPLVTPRHPAGRDAGRAPAPTRP